MWRNLEVLKFADWLRGHNARLSGGERVSFSGLDVYSLGESIHILCSPIRVESIRKRRETRGSGTAV